MPIDFSVDDPPDVTTAVPDSSGDSFGFKTVTPNDDFGFKPVSKTNDFGFKTVGASVPKTQPAPKKQSPYLSPGYGDEFPGAGSGGFSVGDTAQVAQAPLITLPGGTGRLLAPIGEILPKPIGEAIQEKAQQFAEGMTSPLSVALTALPGTGLTGKALSMIYGAFTLPSAIEGAAEIGQALAEGDTKKLTKGGIDVTVGLAPMAGEMAASRASKIPPVIPKTVGEVLTPKTSEAMQAIAPPEEPPFIQPTAPTEGSLVADMEQPNPELATVVTPQRRASQQEMIGMGGAVPSEFTPSGGTPTSIKNAVVDQERVKRGLPPVAQVAKRDFGTVWDEAMARIDRDPQYQDDLISSLRETPRALTDMEDAMLLHRQIDLQNEYGKAARDLAQAFDDGRMDAVAEEKLRVNRMSDQLQDLYDIGKRAGTETGRGLNARKMMANEDYSLASLETRLRASKDGAPLTDLERADLTRIADEYKATSEALQTRLSEQEARTRDLETQAAIDRVFRETQPKVSPYVMGIAEKIAKTIRANADESRAFLKGKAFSLDPEVAYHLARVGADNILTLSTDFAKWSSKMVSDFGEGIKPHLKNIFEESKGIYDKLAYAATKSPKIARQAVDAATRQTLGERTAEIAGQIKAKTDQGQTDISGLAHKLAKEFVASGVKDREALIDAVHGVLETVLPGITRSESRDAISGYGKFSQLSKDEVSVQLRDLKGQMQQVAKLEDMQQGEAPKKTGVERRAPSDTERALIKQVNEAKKKGGYSVTDPATQLRSALQAQETRLKNQITDLEHEIATKTRIVKQRSAVPTSPEVDALRVHRDELKAEHEEIFGKRGMTDEQRLQAWKKRTETRIEDLQKRIDTEDFGPRPKKEPPKLDAEAQALQAKKAAVELEFDRKLEQNRLANRTTFQKAADTLVKWRRGFLLSSPTTLAKLTSAALERVGFSALEEGVGGVISRAIPSVAERAPREGGLSVTAEVKALTDGLTKGMKDAAQTLKTGHSELDLIYGKPELVPPTLIDFFGHLHGALKAPTKRAEFARSFQKRSESAVRAGVDVTDPLVQTRLSLEAYKDAQRSIFMQDNRVVAAYKRAISALEQKDKVTGKVPVGGKTASAVAQVLLPIVKVPTNIVAETMQYAVGSVTGVVKLANAFRKGVETLRPEEADLIMRDLKKGSLGAALLLLGYFNADKIGGYYQPGQQRDKRDVKFGSVRLYDHDIPAFLIHNPLLETLQIGATVRRVADSKLKKTDNVPQGVWTGMMAGGLGLIEEVPFIREMMEGAKAFNPRERTAFFGELGKSIAVPQLLQALARYQDQDASGETVKRNPSTILEHIETGIPGLRKNVPIKKEKK